jgi:hypothetical protein
MIEIAKSKEGDAAGTKLRGNAGRCLELLIFFERFSAIYSGGRHCVVESSEWGKQDAKCKLKKAFRVAAGWKMLEFDAHLPGGFR